MHRILGSVYLIDAVAYAYNTPVVPLLYNSLLEADNAKLLPPIPKIAEFNISPDRLIQQCLAEPGRVVLGETRPVGPNILLVKFLYNQPTNGATLATKEEDNRAIDEAENLLAAFNTGVSNGNPEDGSVFCNQT